MDSRSVRCACSVLVVASILHAGSEAARADDFFGPTPYLSAADSPFSSSELAWLHLETFEDGTLDTPGVTSSSGSVVLPATHSDSVDGDDGTVDGSGAGGHSFTPGNTTTIRFTFDDATLGALPTHAGIVWTDLGFNSGGIYGFGNVSFEAFGADGTSLGIIGPFPLGDGLTNGQTAEDRFFGITAPGGISAIELSGNSNDWEVDHLQYGRARADHFQCYKSRDSRGEICAAASPSNAGASCNAETDCGGVEDDTDFCGRSAPVKGTAMELTDEIESGVFGAVKLAAVCNPAEKNGEAIGDANTRLLAYKIKAAPGQPKAGETGIGVVNQFHDLGELEVDTIKVDRLLVPAAVSDTTPVPAPDPAAHTVDHYKCYKIKVTKGTPRFTRISGVSVADAFTDPAAFVDLVKPARLCMAAQKTLPPDGEPEPVRNAAAALLCYRARLAKTDPKQARHEPVLGLYAADQLGAARIDTKKSETLCVPSSVEVGETP